MRWIKDEDFIRGKVPMTKFEVRMATIGLLEIEEGDNLLDIGAGTGSISIEAALQGAVVTALESNEEAISLIKENSKKFGVDIKVIAGKAPETMKDIKGYNKCFIGGSGGNLREIFETVHCNLPSRGLIYANFITLGNMNTFIELLKEYRYEDINIRMLQASAVDGKTGLLKAQNPVFIVGGRKK